MIAAVRAQHRQVNQVVGTGVERVAVGLGWHGDASVGQPSKPERIGCTGRADQGQDKESEIQHRHWNKARHRLAFVGSE